MRGANASCYPVQFLPRCTTVAHSRAVPGDHGICVVSCPGSVMLMTPAQAHMRIEVLSSEGRLSSVTVGEPGVHGDGVAGMHACGVSTPIAAGGAAATAGF